MLTERSDLLLHELRELLEERDELRSLLKEAVDGLRFYASCLDGARELCQECGQDIDRKGHAENCIISRAESALWELERR